MNSIRTHHDLDVWKVSMDIVIDLYRITEAFPNAERFVLVMQIRQTKGGKCSN